jgi:hypothetical protein
VPDVIAETKAPLQGDMHANQIGNDIQICEKYTDEYFATQELFK